MNRRGIRGTVSSGFGVWNDGQNLRDDSALIFYWQGSHRITSTGGPIIKCKLILLLTNHVNWLSLYVLHHTKIYLKIFLFPFTDWYSNYFDNLLDEPPVLKVAKGSVKRECLWCLCAGLANIKCDYSVKCYEITPSYYKPFNMPLRPLGHY